MYCRCIKKIFTQFSYAKSWFMQNLKPCSVSAYSPLCIIIETHTHQIIVLTAIYRLTWFLSTYSTSCIPRTIWSILCVYASRHVVDSMYSYVLLTCILTGQSWEQHIHGNLVPYDRHVLHGMCHWVLSASCSQQISCASELYCV